MSHAVPKKLKGVYCLSCLGSRLRTVSSYRPLKGVKICYCRCTNPACGAKVKLRVTLIYPEVSDTSPLAG